MGRVRLGAGQHRIPAHRRAEEPRQCGRSPAVPAGDDLLEPQLRRAHPVRGTIGWLWGTNGYEGGRFGYPTTDEYNADHIGGNVDDNKGVRQGFQHDRYLLWSPGQADAFETCQTQCAGYLGVTDTAWVKQTEVYINLADGRRSVHVTPTDAAFKDAKGDLQENWRQVWSNTPIFPNATPSEQSSTSKQLYCHAAFSFPSPGGGHFGGPTWDLETWREDIPWDSGKMLAAKCNW